MNALMGGVYSLIFMLALLSGYSQSSAAAGPDRLSSAAACAAAASPKADRVLALKGDHLSAEDLRLLRDNFPAPRIIAINGTLSLARMDRFSAYLAAMGYPEERIQNPVDGSGSYSSAIDSAELAGMVAWYYEQEGLMPLVIGYSRGGMLAVKLLHELAGSFDREMTVWNPYENRSEERATIIDPASGRTIPVAGLKLRFVSAIATGRVMRLLLGQWNMLKRLRSIPDTTAEFSGYHLPGDPISGTLFGVGSSDLYHAEGSAVVRNIVLPADTGHLSVLPAGELLRKQGVNEWIEAYRPGKEGADPIAAWGEGSPLLAADIWQRIKAAWAGEVQDWIRARRLACRG